MPFTNSTGMDNNPVKVVDFQSSLPIPFQPFFAEAAAVIGTTASDDDDDRPNENENHSRTTSISPLSPWNHIVLSPCLIGFGGSDYLCYPNACTNQVRIVDIHTGEIVNCLTGHLDYPICCCYRDSLCEV